MDRNGRNKIQGGIQQQDVVRSGSLVKWSTLLPLMATVQTQYVREEIWRENIKDDGSSTRLADWKINEMKHMRFKTTQKNNRITTKNMNKYPQVRKTGVDALHGSCAQMV